MKSEQQQQNQSSSTEGVWVELAVIVVVLVAAWPALLVGAVTHLFIKQRASNPQPYWFLAAGLGCAGACFLFLRANPYPLFLVVLHDLVPLIKHFGGTTLTHLLSDEIPLWERSLLVFPLCTVLIELLMPKSLKETLLTQEKRHRATQAQKSKRARSLGRHTPDQVKGKAVLGVLIEHLTK